MRLKSELGKMVMIVFAIAVLIGTSKAGQSLKTDIAGPSKIAPTRTDSSLVQKLKPQSTCPIMGGPIDKTQYVDYKGKRIYVCCPACIDPVKKDPEKCIKKLDEIGQSVESIGDTAKGAGKPPGKKKCFMSHCPFRKSE